MGVSGKRRAGRTGWRLWGLLGVTLLGACTANQGSVRDDAPQIALKRGARWSVLTLRPPHLSGPHFHLLLKNGVLSGSIQSATAPGGHLKVNIGANGAHGYGPLGPVQMEYAITEDSTVVDGTWNGQRVHLVFRRDSVKGTVADNSESVARSDPDGLAGMQSFRNSQSRGRGVTVNANMIDPLPRNSSCEYFLNEVSSDGGLNGGSICSGLPQQTRLEVPKIAEKWMTRPELLTVLVAVLSSPPAVAADDFAIR